MDGPRSTPANSNDVHAQVSETFTLPDLLRNRDLPCPRCRYNLRNLTTPTCPECGLPLTPDSLLRPHPPSHAAWTLLLVALSMGWLESFRYWRSFLFAHVYPVSFYAEWPGWLLPAASRVYWISILPAIALTLYFRPRFVRLPAAIRWTLAAAALVLTLMAHRRVLLGDYPYY